MKQILSCGLAWAALAAPVSAATISFAGTPMAVHVGEAFTVDVLVSDAADLYAFQFDVSFAPAIAEAHEVIEGDFLTSGGATSFVPGAIDNIVGTVSFTANTLLGPGSGVSGDGVLVRLSFQALAPGQSDLLFENLVLLDSTLAEIDTVPIDGAIRVAAVSEPGTAVLAGLGLVVLASGLRRRAAASALQRRIVRARVGP